jgi:hypothetical protein
MTDYKANIGKGLAKGEAGYPAFTKDFNAAIAVSISRTVLKQDKENRTVPLGKVFNVLCASGEQCSPDLEHIPHRASR